jgi:subtilisin family serine protease
MTRYRRGVWFVAVGALSLLLTACTTTTREPGVGTWSYVNSDLGPFWWYELLKLRTVHLDKGATGMGRTIAIVDTGVVTDHEDLKNVLLQGVATCGTNRNDTSDTNGHGTQLAGIALGRDPGPDPAFGHPPVTQGVAPDARLLPIKVDCGVVSADSLVNGVTAAIAKTPDVILIALGGYPAGTPDVHERLKNLVTEAGADGAQKGILFVVASVWDDKAYPLPVWTKLNNVIAVAAMTQEKLGGPDLPFNDKVGAISAPGQNVGTADIQYEQVLSSLPLPRFHAQFLMQGTSAASAIVAGCAALVKEKMPNLTGAEVKTALTDAAKRSNGRLNCNEAVPR